MPHTADFSPSSRLAFGHTSWRRMLLLGVCGFVLAGKIPATMAQTPSRFPAELTEASLFPGNSPKKVSSKPVKKQPTRATEHSFWDTAPGSSKYALPAEYLETPTESEVVQSDYIPSAAPAVVEASYTVPPMDGIPGYPLTSHSSFPEEPTQIITHPHNVIFKTIKAGGVFSIGNGKYADILEPGWTVQGAGRALIDWPNEDLVPFAELGGGYMHQYGEAKNETISDATLTQSVNTTPISQGVLPDSVRTELQELHRGWVHLALGTIFNTANDDSGFQFTGRVGVRLGHVDARFTERPTAAAASNIQGLIDSQPGVDFDLDAGNENTDVFWGVVTGAGVSTPWQSIWLYDHWISDANLGVEFEYIHDWFDLGTFDEGTNGLSNINVMLNLSLKR